MQTPAARRRVNVLLGMRAPDDGDVYLTDGVFLFRIIGPICAGDDAVAQVEDCYSLNVIRIPVRELVARGLRPVTSPPDQAG